MQKLKRVIFLGRKPLSVKAVEFLLEQNIQISLIVAPEKENYPSSVPIISDNKELYAMIEAGNEKTKDIDLVISYLYPKRIKTSLINLPKYGCINFHPAPLPDYKSRAGYNTAILDRRDWFGVSAHFIDSEEFDAGPIIEVLSFPINPDGYLMDLISESQEQLFVLFKKTIKKFQQGNEIITKEYRGGLYLDGRELEQLKLINIEKDSLEEIKKKIRAFFFPPYRGATIEIKGEKFTLLDEDTLQYLAKILKDKI